MISIIVWLDGFITPVEMIVPNNTSPLYEIIYKLLSPFPFWSSILAFFIMLIESLLITNLLSEQKLIPRNTFLTAFLFIIFAAFNPAMLCLNPVFISYLFLIPAVAFIIKMYVGKESLIYCFNASLLTGLASLVYFPTLYFLLVIWLGLYLFSIFKWREWLVSFIGITIPYIFLFVFYFWFDQLHAHLQDYHEFIVIYLGLNFSLSDEQSVFLSIFSIYLGFLVLLSIIKGILSMNEKTISLRKLSSFFIYFLLFSQIVFFMRDTNNIVLKSLQILPLTIVLSLYFSNIKRTFISELLFSLLIILTLAGKLFL